MTAGKYIRQLRLKQGLSVFELARRAQMSGATLEKIERDNPKALTHNAARTLAKVLGVKTDDLLAGDTAPRGGVEQ